MKFITLFARSLVIAGLALVLTGCLDEEQQWNAKEIDGMLPDLEFTLTRSDGETVTAEEYQGQVRLMFFGFTNCPDVCPATLSKLTRAIKAMPADLQDDVTPLFVSVDPKRDTPERLGEYVNFFYDRTVGLTADEPTLRKLAKRYRTTFGYDEPDERGNYNVSHSAAIYVFDGQGNARLLLRSDLPTDQITEDLVQLARQARS
ncbi:MULTISPECIES: SCO family protein [Marinobacter]|uniref:Protein SCO1/2 n=1 Tax=Marinobacter segnicrescens TaxID=430453 RepID=A0A1I0CH21_9GAMM|nr:MULTISPECIES: SCO family protein [Marinobacter]UZD64996.1 SCO family protein [Marinobacter sp. AN1]SET18908.1 protein SCO1/2 [Marinobacter segnicrescens]